MPSNGFPGYRLIAATIGLATAAAFGAFDANTIAFYPFDEGEDGESALGEGLLKNAVNPSLYAGTGTTTADDSGLKFSSDVPGRCIFAGAGGADLLYSGVRSVHAYGSKAANLSLAGLRVSGLACT